MTMFCRRVGTFLCHGSLTVPRGHNVVPNLHGCYFEPSPKERQSLVVHEQYFGIAAELWLEDRALAMQLAAAKLKELLTAEPISVF